jgi:hypothetical protein
METDQKTETGPDPKCPKCEGRGLLQLDCRYASGVRVAVPCASCVPFAAQALLAVLAHSYADAMRWQQTPNWIRRALIRLGLA